MIECQEELWLMTSRLRTAMVDADLREREVEALLGLAPGAWGRMRSDPCGPPLDADQERRARLAIELVTRLASQLGSPDLVRDWITEPSRWLDGCPPLAWVADDAARLHAIVVCLREAAR